MTDVNRGLDLSRPGETTPEERQRFQEWYGRVLGRSHRGLDFWLDTAPDTLKRYRHFANSADVGERIQDRVLTQFGFLQYYALTGYTAGVRYLVHIYQTIGCTREMILEALTIAFLHTGPRGMETVAEALDDYPWITPDHPPEFPAGWAPDPDAFISGLDFGDPALSEAEAGLLADWYRRWLGEVPRYVPHLTRYQPRLLKAFRNRFEHCVRVLPKQFVPTTLLHYNVTRGFGDGIREDVLMCRGFGVSLEEVQSTIGSALLYGGMEAASIVDEHAGDVLAAWGDAA
jgi:hypothetical protein